MADEHRGMGTDPTVWTWDPPHPRNTDPDRDAQRSPHRGQELSHAVAMRLAGVAAFALGADRALTWSDEAPALLGVPSDTIPTLDLWLRCFAPNGRRRLSEALFACLCDGSAFDVVVDRAEGRAGRLRVIGEADRDDDGALRGVRGALRHEPAPAPAPVGDVARAPLGERNRPTSLSPQPSRLPVAIGAWRVEVGRPTAWLSDEARAIHELAPDTHPTTTALSRFYDEVHRARVWRAFERCIHEGAPIDEEVRFVTATGRRRWVRVSGRAVRDAGGAIVALEGSIADLGDVGADDPSLATSDLATLADAMPFVVWTATDTGDLDFVNGRFYAMLGFTEATSIATDHWISRIHPDDVDRAHQAWTAGFTSRESWSFECRFAGEDPQYRWFRVQATPVLDAEGRLVKWYGTAIDIHEARRLEQEASQLANRVTTILESITDAFYTVDADWRFTYVNREAEHLLRRPRAELLGRELWQEFPALVDTVLDREFRRAAEVGKSASFELFYSPHDRWFDVKVYPSAAGLSVYFRDISDVRRDREALIASEQRFQLVCDLTNDAVWDYDPESGRLWWSDGFHRLFGEPEDTAEPGLRAWLDRIHPEDRDAVVAQAQATFDGDGTDWVGGYRMLRHDGSILHVADHGRVIRDASGRGIRMIGGLVDITERKRAEAKLREQATLLDKAQDAIVVVDLFGRITYQNRSADRLYGCPIGQGCERPFPALFRDLGAYRAAHAAVIANGEWAGELEQVTCHGKSVVSEGRWTLVRDDHGQPRAILAISTDVTERKRLEQQFLRAQRMESVGTLAGGLAHDLNNALAPILMSLTLLREGEADPERLEDLATIETCARRGAEMVRQLLTFARGHDARPRDLRLGEVAAEVQRVTRDSFPKNIEVRLEVPSDRCAVHADPTQMHQLLINLCVNARDAMPDGGVLTLGVEPRTLDAATARRLGATAGPYVRVVVEDTGTGMSPETLDRLYEPFFTTKPIGRGTGLGLSTVHGIVERHHGVIHCRSELGRGTRFEVYLPAIGEAPAVDPATSRARPPRGAGELILVVDDEEGVRNAARRTLERFGYRVIHACDGAEAVRIYRDRADEIALVLTDMAMPVLDGPATIAALRAIDPRVRIIASSGFGTSEQVAKATAAGPVQFVAKPYTTDTLLGVVRQTLADGPR